MTTSSSLDTIKHLADAYDSMSEALKHSNDQDFVSIIEEIERLIRKTAKQHPIIEDLLSLPKIPVIPAVRFALMIRISSTTSLTSLWNFCGVNLKGGKNNSSGTATKRCLTLVGELSRAGGPYHLVYFNAAQSSTFDENEALGAVARVFLSHYYVQAKIHAGTLTEKDLPPAGRPYANRAFFGWPNPEKKYERTMMPSQASVASK